MDIENGKKEFINFDKEFFENEKYSIQLVCDLTNKNPRILERYKEIIRFFPPAPFDFRGDEDDYVFLISLRKTNLSKYTRCYVEYLIAKCKKHFADSDFCSDFDDLAPEIVTNAKSKATTINKSFFFFLLVESSLYKERFSDFVSAFTKTLVPSLNINQINILTHCLTLLGAVSENVKKEFFEAVYDSLDVEIDNQFVILSCLDLVAKIIENSNGEEKDSFLVLYAKLVAKIPAERQDYDPVMMQRHYNKGLELLSKDRLNNEILADPIFIKRKAANELVRKAAIKPTFVTDKIMENRQKNFFATMESAMKKISFPKRVWFLLNCLPPFSVTGLQDDISKADKDSLDIESYMNEDGRLINAEDLTDSESFSLKAREHIEALMNGTYINAIICFSMANKGTPKKEIFSFADSIVKTNTIISDDDKDEMKTLLANIFLNRFEERIESLISHFERSLKMFMSQRGISTRKLKTNSDDEIGLGDIFSSKKDSRYAKELITVIGEDSYFTFEWMLVDKFGWNLRNELAHGMIPGNKKKSYDILFASLQIFKFFCRF